MARGKYLAKVTHQGGSEGNDPFLLKSADTNSTNNAVARGETVNR